MLPPALLLTIPPVSFLLYSPLQSTLPPSLIHLLQSEIDISAVSGGSGKWLASSLVAQGRSLLSFDTTRAGTWCGSAWHPELEEKSTQSSQPVA